MKRGPFACPDLKFGSPCRWKRVMCLHYSLIKMTVTIRNSYIKNAQLILSDLNAVEIRFNTKRIAPRLLSHIYFIIYKG